LLLRGAGDLAPTQAPTALATRPSSEPDNLKFIVGVGPVLEAALRDHGVTSFAQIAAWTADDVTRFEATLPGFQAGRIAREEWVAQARAFVAQQDRGEELRPRDDQLT